MGTTHHAFLHVAGVPTVGSAFGVPTTRGRVWFVDGTNGHNDNTGLDRDSAFAAIGTAISRATSGAGDVILVFPGTYAENLVVTKHDLQIVGVVLPGYARPDIAPAAGMALLVNNAHGFVGRHLRFVSADDDAAKNEGNGYVFEDCVFEGNVAGLRLQGDATTSSYAASEGIIRDCLFRNCGGDALIFQHPAAPSSATVTDVQVLECRFYNNTGDDIATAAAGSGGGGGIVQTLLIRGCSFMSIDKAVYLDLDQASFAGGDEASNRGLICGCYFADDAALDATKIDLSGTSLRFVGNYNAIGIVDGSTFDD